MALKKGNWTWVDEQPAAVVVVLLILAFILFVPKSSCRPNPGDSFERPGAGTQVRWLFRAPADESADREGEHGH